MKILKPLKIALLVLALAVGGSFVANGLVVLWCVMGGCEGDTESVRQSHIVANVPAQDEIEGMLRRDLLAYFRARGQPQAERVEVQLLRDMPTQSGVATPKYYVWLRLYGASGLLEEGAARVMAVERDRFDVTRFLSKPALAAHTEDAGKTFPAALLPKIEELAKQ